MTMHGCTYVQPLTYQGVFATYADIQIRACVLLCADLGQVVSKLDVPKPQTSITYVCRMKEKPRNHDGPW